MVYVGSDLPEELKNDPAVLHWKPSPCWPTATQAQVIRLLYPGLNSRNSPFPKISQGQSAPMSAKQCPTTLRLDLCKMTAQLWLRHIAQLRHLGQAAMFDHFKKQSPLLRTHPKSRMFIIHNKFIMSNLIIL
jgi:hypothetical protein